MLKGAFIGAVLGGGIAAAVVVARRAKKSAPTPLEEVQGPEVAIPASPDVLKLIAKCAAEINEMIATGAWKRPDPVVTRDVEGRAALTALGIPVSEDTCDDSDDDTPPPTMAPRARTAYLAVKWHSVNNVPVEDEARMRALVPVHTESPRKPNVPYVNTTVLHGCVPLRSAVLDRMQRHIDSIGGADALVAFETRALMLAAALAERMRLPLVTARRVGDVAGARVLRQAVTGASSYRDSEVIGLDAYALPQGTRTVIVDDVARTGTTMRALRALLEGEGVEVVGCMAWVGVGSEEEADYWAVVRVEL